jgi:hypothetical protein
MARLMVRLGSVLMLILALAACGDDTTTPTTPTTPTTVTETFSGTVNQNGAVTHTFTTTTSGTVTATLTTLGPDSTFVMGMSIGTWNGANCQLVLTNDSATQGTVITGGTSALGTFCVRAYDVGNITAGNPFTYEITVTHP